MNIFAGLLLVGFLGACFVFSRRRRLRGRQLPPGPPGLPIIGNIPQPGLNPHKSLTQLAKTYGPLMSLHLGTQLAVVVSSPEMATELLQKNGATFSDRSIPAAVRVHDHHHYSVNILPPNSDRWKKLRRIAKEKLFSNQALQAGRSLRREGLKKLADGVRRCSEEGQAMNVGEATFTTMINLIFATLFSIEVAGSNKEFREHVNAFTRYVGVPNICDFFPIFSGVDPQGMRRKIGHHLGSLLEIVGGMIQQRLQARRELVYQKKNDFLETLLDLMEGNEYDLNIEEIKHLFVDLIIAGSDTSAATTEWAMVELLLHPHKLAKVRDELKRVVGERVIVEESDISKLPYLQATIKEVLRYHPVAPLLGPREAAEDTIVNGYLIPKHARIIVNFWAITRDSRIWKNPECFEPERFVGMDDIDFEGQHSELIPFGSGRRICPGMPLAGRMLHCMVGTLCHNYNWKLEKEGESEQLQREDVFGLALQKKTPLRAIPFKI